MDFLALCNPYFQINKSLEKGARLMQGIFKYIFLHYHYGIQDHMQDEIFSIASHNYFPQYYYYDYYSYDWSKYIQRERLR